VKKVLVTGSCGLIGSAVSLSLKTFGYEVVELDVRNPPGSEGRGDVNNLMNIKRRMADCLGIVHLAAVSRVVSGQRNPELCWKTNVGGTSNVLTAAAAAPERPWVLFASSREVYGEPESIPVGEDAPLRPVNVYGRSKAEGERLVLTARAEGLQTAVVRFSNVYGSTDDHPDRVVPAFCNGAVHGGPLRVDGSGNFFDFTHIDDVVRGILGLVNLLAIGARELQPVHLVTGTGTTLRELAKLANLEAGGRSPIVEAPSRDCDVARFVGDPRRARRLLGWQSTISLADGVAHLVRAFRMRSLKIQRERCVGAASAGAAG
jgi:UDP-glucose 4-epimerase